MILLRMLSYVIVLHIGNGDKCGTENEIGTKLLSVINKVSAQEISLTIKC